MKNEQIASVVVHHMVHGAEPGIAAFVRPVPMVNTCEGMVPPEARDQDRRASKG